MNNSIFPTSFSCSPLDHEEPNLTDLIPRSLSRNSSHISDTDSVSDDSRKIRKKRNTYHKIPDDIRVELLESVKNGETLKAAAKRFKVNYSSAKSILHTYRKEGRILKKAGQERNTKKRASTPERPEKPEKKTSIFAREAKQNNKDNKERKENAKIVSHDSEFPCEMVPYSERTASASTCASLSEERPVLSVINQNENPVVDLPNKTEQKEQGKRTLNAGSNISSILQDLAYLNGSGDFAKTPKQTIKFFDNFMAQPDFKFPSTGNDYGLDSQGYLGNMNNCDEFGAFDGLTGAFQRKVSLDETGFNEHSALLYPAGFTPAKMDENNAGKTFKFDGYDNSHYMEQPQTNTHFMSFLDTQNMFRDALRKASITFRKNSFDMF